MQANQNQQLEDNNWNIFARELQAIMASRQLRLDQLSETADIDPDKVRSLSQSLREPGHFPILNIEEMEQVTHNLRLSDDDVLRLRAALFATAIQKMLTERIPPEDALHIAQSSLPNIFTALQKQSHDNNSLKPGEGVRGGDGGPMMNETGTLFERIAHKINAGDIELQLSRNIRDHDERIQKARLARAQYENARELLEFNAENLSELRLWDRYSATIKDGIIRANERLQDLGK